MGTNPKVCLLGGMGGRSLVVFQGRKVGLFNFPRNLFFGGVGWGVWRKKVGIYIYLFIYFFCDMVT
jgi:hypothetical protein